MKKGTFYSKVRYYGDSEPQDYKLKRYGYLVTSASGFMFGIFKNEYRDFDIIDLKSGLSINCLNYYKLKDIKEDIEKYAEKLDNFIKANKLQYNNLIKEFNELKIKEEEN